MRDQFAQIKIQNDTDGFRAFLGAEYGNSPQDLKKLLEYLYQMTKDEQFESWLVDLVLQECMEQQDDIYTILQLRQQQRHYYNSLHRKQKIEDEWRINQYFSEKMAEVWDDNFAKIPVADRDQDCIVIAATQILGIRHAPTRIVFELCNIIQKYLHKKVILINAVEPTDPQVMKQYGFGDIYIISYLPELNGPFLRRYKGTSIPSYQILI